MILAIWACELPSDQGGEDGVSSEPAPPSQEEDELPDSVSEGGSRCEVTEHTLTCDHQTTTVFTGFSGLLPREVHWQVPLGEPPPEGWPAVLLFQGSLFTAELFWVALEIETFGYYNQGMVTKTLLDSGFAVLAPEAHAGGFTAWDTNIPPMSLLWELSEDHQFMLDIFEGIEEGTFGELDAGRLYASGISSGGYMTSRMDLAYRERFRALAVHSASFATCSGPLCVLPGDLSAEHLPTLFLHGDDDAIVPIWTMELYRDALLELGVEVDTVIEPGTGHAWIDDSPTAIVEWFEAH
jgi:pimeloyl-ACP methyl ester carboxylesterase